MRHLRWSVVVMGLAAALFGRPATAFGTTIAIYTVAQSSTFVYPGQSITTPAGGPWDNITFTWLNNGVDSAAGNLFLLSQTYVGSPSGLTTSTAGYISHAAASGGLYSFASSLTLQPLTQYFFFTDSPLSLTLAFAGTYPGGNASYAIVGTTPPPSYFPLPPYDMNFRLDGSAVASTVPEPASLALVGIGLTAVACRLRRRRNRA